MQTKIIKINENIRNFIIHCNQYSKELLKLLDPDEHKLQLWNDNNIFMKKGNKVDVFYSVYVLNKVVKRAIGIEFSCHGMILLFVKVVPDNFIVDTINTWPQESIVSHKPHFFGDNQMKASDLEKEHILALRQYLETLDSN